MGPRFQITCAAELESLQILRDYIDKACNQFPQVNPQVRYDLKLAVDEACSNIITHGYAGIDPGTVILAFDILPDCIALTITDFGHPFEPSEPDLPDISEQYELGTADGFGLFFIYQTMDDISYETSPAGNVLRFIKHLEG